MHVCVRAILPRRFSFLALPALNKIICVQTSIPPIYIHTYMNTYKSCVHLFIVQFERRARTPTDTIVLEIQIQKLQNVHSGTTGYGPWWYGDGVGGGTACCVPNLLLHCSAICCQSKCNAKQMHN